MKLVVATTSAHKWMEIRDLLSDVPNLEVLSLRDFDPLEEPDENGLTMRDNARIKAQAYAQAFNMPTLADDSGVEVDALGGAPGVHSARWIEGSDADRTSALLERLKNTPDVERGARYRCALCFTGPQSTMIELEATCEGRIAYEPRGTNGFGYDPIFELTEATGTPPEWIGHTIAEAPPEIKAQISHRARAVRQLAAQLHNLSTR
ncbi:MAG: XTP/dITP diphosphohydrolase [Abditibacteriota bacterium]|jgi:XTP/dITP diphosphohydrolase|nr:XTP/dITP diphosphohydrolase [Abditibacteriota bacterium]